MTVCSVLLTWSVTGPTESTRLVALHGAVTLIDYVNRCTALVEPPLVITNHSSDGQSTYLLYQCSCTVRTSQPTQCLFNTCTTSAPLSERPLSMPQHDVPLTHGLNASLLF